MGDASVLLDTRGKTGKFWIPSGLLGTYTPTYSFNSPSIDLYAGYIRKYVTPYLYLGTSSALSQSQQHYNWESHEQGQVISRGTDQRMPSRHTFPDKPEYNQVSQADSTRNANRKTELCVVRPHTGMV
jgi:hypothetical protein